MRLSVLRYRIEAGAERDKGAEESDIKDSSNPTASHSTAHAEALCTALEALDVHLVQVYTNDTTRPSTYQEYMILPAAIVTERGKTFSSSSWKAV